MKDSAFSDHCCVILTLVLGHWTPKDPTMKILLLMTMLCVSSFGASITQISAVGASIPDNDPAGVSVDLIFVDARLITGNLSVTINSLLHTWIGDLSATLTHVGTGTTVSLFQRPGRTSSGSGCGAHFNGSYTFSDLGSSTLGAVCPASGADVPPGTFRASADVGASDELAVILGSAFNGQSAGGTWRLFLSDQSGLDTGSFASWTLQADVAPTASPEPAALAMLATGLGFLALARRLR